MTAIKMKMILMMVEKVEEQVVKPLSQSQNLSCILPVVRRDYSLVPSHALPSHQENCQGGAAYSNSKLL